MILERKEDVKNTMINEIVKFMTTPAYVLDNVFPTIMSEQNFDRLSEKWVFKLLGGNSSQ